MNDRILKQLTFLIKDFFGEALEFALVFGSRARNEHRANSDVDLMLVFTDGCEKSKIEDFKQRFVSFQKEHGLIADAKFPGEFLTLADLQKAIAGYGFVRNEDCLEIDLMIGPTIWSSFNEYRQWLCAMAGPNKFLTGNENKFTEYQQNALRSVILSALLARKADMFAVPELLEELVAKGKNYLGFCDTQFSRNFLLSNLPKICEHLERENLISQSAAEYILDRMEGTPNLRHLF